MQHYTDFSTISDAFIGFAQYARAEGFKIGIDESKESVRTALAGMLLQKPFFEFGLAAIFCNSPEDRDPFAIIYDRFWNERGNRQKSKTTYQNQSNLRKPSQGTLAMIGMGESEGRQMHAAKSTSGANRLESLRKTDFSQVRAVDHRVLDQLCQQLVKEMSLRIRRKFRQGRRGQIDIAATIRKSIQHGGNFLSVQHREKRREKLRLIMLLDVSGSMDKYSFYLLRFIYALRSHFKNIEVFSFSTQLVRISEYLHPKNLDLSLSLLSHVTDHWSSGTKIGECLQTFNDRYAKRVLNGRSQTIILSDGLDTGEPHQLAHELKRIKMRTKHLIWLNPLKGMEGFQPIQRGMKAALPQVDEFRSAHNLQSLLTLENIISYA